MHITLIQTQAPQSTDAAAANYLRSNDKFNVVFTVVITIFVVIVCFLVWLERRVNSLEKTQKKNSNI